MPVDAAPCASECCNTAENSGSCCDAKAEPAKPAAAKPDAAKPEPAKKNN